MTQAAQFAETYITPTLFARLAVGFGILAVLLVASGLYGTLAYRVERRTGEIGVRMALGSSRTSVLWMVARESLTMLVAGWALGLPLAFLVSRFLRSELWQLSYLDGFSFLLAIALTFLVTVASALVPARRASSVDPMMALRYE